MARLFLTNTPIVVFIIIWISVFSVYSADYFQYHRADSGTIILLLSGIVAVLSGYLISSIVYRNNSAYNKTIPNTYGESYFDEGILRRLTIITILFYVAGGAANFYVFSTLAGGADQYINDPNYIRLLSVMVGKGEIENVPIIYRFAGFITSIGLLSNIFAGALFHKATTTKYLAFIPLVANVFVSLVNVQRYLFIAGISFWIFSYIFTVIAYKRTNNLPFLTSVMRMLVVISVIIFVFNYYVVTIRSSHQSDVETFFYKTLYAYFAGNVSSFDIWLNDPNHHVQFTFGQTIFRDIFRYLAKLGIWESSEVKTMHQQFVSIGKYMTINTFTFVKAMYEDFSIYGVLGFSFIWGAIAKYSTVAFLENQITSTSFS